MVVQIVQLRLLARPLLSSKMKYARVLFSACSASSASSLRCAVRSVDINRRRRRYGGSHSHESEVRLPETSPPPAFFDPAVSTRGREPMHETVPRRISIIAMSQ
jgi:hypothetical protein